MRSKKVIRLHYWGELQQDEAHLTILENPGEARLGCGNKSFISVKEDQVSISGGTPSTISIQGMSSSFKYAGMLQDLPFPLSILPVTALNPMPLQLMVPPLVGMLPTITQAAAIASSLIGL